MNFIKGWWNDKTEFERNVTINWVCVVVVMICVFLVIMYLLNYVSKVGIKHIVFEMWNGTG